MNQKRLPLLLLAVILQIGVLADDGHSLWLGKPEGKPNTATVIAPEGSATIEIAKKELLCGWQQPDTIQLVLDKSLNLGEGFRIIAGSHNRITLCASQETGLLYGAYDLLRCQKATNKTEKPAFPLRLLNHWDNLDGSIERGYAGNSIFWSTAPLSSHLSPLNSNLLTTYARANASIGINGTVLNNVNASPKILTAAYLQEVRNIADILRPYGIRVYLSINFASPMIIGGLKTADPLNPQVRRWWKQKVQEIYQLVPDFGGFLVKANSEGQPGPGDYQRSHADGANMLADALKPHNGIVIWRCFVYGANHKGEDRVKQAVSEFKPLDGQFRDNVILQTKNGPLDFQPREPYSPVFDQIRHTPNMAELQITQEYLGQSKHLVYLAPMWKEFFAYVSPRNLKGVAGVANIGDDTNWCGHHFSQANWYAFGRLAWNPDLSSEQIAREWLSQTFGDYRGERVRGEKFREERVGEEVIDMMLSSREACVDYMMPLGLHHIFKFDHHYGPEPDGFKAEYPIEWCPVYYHKADSMGIGFNRSSTGTDAVSQYNEPFASIYNDINTCPENLLLWFHHVPWSHRMKSGRTLWQEMNHRYNLGVQQVEQYLDTWQHAKPWILLCDGGDDRRWREVNDRLHIQLDNAREWRNVCLGYFQTFSKQPIE